MGAGRIRQALPPLAEAVAASGSRYETACDPRLNRSQSLDLAFRVADLYRPSSRPD
jgi:hypothetical protein